MIICKHHTDFPGIYFINLANQCFLDAHWAQTRNSTEHMVLEKKGQYILPSKSLLKFHYIIYWYIHITNRILIWLKLELIIKLVLEPTNQEDIAHDACLRDLP